ncbi:MAG: amidase [Bacteroidales bacterium]|nr:amidase [Bacteroidales bacterium]
MMLQTLSLLKSGALDLHSYLDGWCDRIEEADGALHCFVEEPGRRSRLHAEAGALLEKYGSEEQRPPLFGLPIGVKDIIRVSGLETRCGSALPAELFYGEEAELVRLLKDAGALVLGKTVTTEFAWFQPGLTKNPLNPGHTPGGSSSGSAAAIAAGLASLTLGTQTVGSVVRPAAYCGVVGVKPSAGSLPTRGIIPFSKSFDQPGYFTADLESAAFVASVITDEWFPEDSPPRDASSTGKVYDYYTKSTDQLQHKPVLGIPDEAYLRQADSNIRFWFDRWVRQLIENGLHVVNTSLFKDIEAINHHHKAVAAKEFAEVHKLWHSEYGSLYGYHSVQLIEAGRKVDQETVRAALMLREHTIRELENVMTKEGIDCWVSPAATSLPPRGLSSTGSPLMSLPWTFTGVPGISVPVAVPETPFVPGLQVCGRLNGLQRLFKDTFVLRDILL